MNRPPLGESIVQGMLNEVANVHKTRKCQGSSGIRSLPNTAFDYRDISRLRLSLVYRSIPFSLTIDFCFVRNKVGDDFAVK